jgi:hypothetical protein
MKPILLLALSLVIFQSSIIAQHTFEVCDVEKAKAPLSETTAEIVFTSLMNRRADNNFAELDNHKQGKPELLCGSMNDKDNLVSTLSHPFVQAIYQAYADHRPLEISPDMMWLLISQGFALHVKENSEKLRDLFVDHEGQVNLNIDRLSYQPNSKSYWEGIFPDFSKAIEKNTKEEVWKMASPKFSTTTKVEKAAFEITLMDAMSPYFTYSVTIICGIPEITVEGTKQDWEKIEFRLEELKKYKLGWWVDDLKHIIKECKNASQGKINKKFWKNIFIVKEQDVTCGTSPYYQGWVFKMFPYLKGSKDMDGNVKYYKNPLVKGKNPKKYESKQVLELNNVPSGLSRAKVLLNDNGTMTMLHFNAGFVGYTQNKETLALRPSIQWFVVDTNVKPSEDEMKKYLEGMKQK